MTPLSALWLAILLSAVIVFVVSSVIHMVLPWHKNDYPTLPEQDRIQDALRPFGLAPGDYMIPRPGTRGELGAPEFREKLSRGPVLVMTVMPPGVMNMARSLSMWFVYSAVVSLFGAYIAGRALPPGSDYLAVFRFVGATTFIGYSLALWQMSIWYRRAWSLTVKATVDGLIYGLLTAGTFGWLWPR